MASPPTLASRIAIRDDVLFQEVNGEAVLLNLKTGVYFGLDPVGTRVWQLLVEPRVLADVLAVVVDEYDVSPERGAGDLIALVTDLEQHGLVALS
jgi:hypothetical protein